MKIVKATDFFDYYKSKEGGMEDIIKAATQAMTSSGTTKESNIVLA